MVFKYIALFFYGIFFSPISGIADAQKIDSYLQTHKDFSGAVLVTQNDSILFKKCYGYANYEFEIPNNFDTKFPIASNTKSFTAVAIMLLQEKNLLNVHDKVSTYIAGFSDSMTIHHLLTHTSGIANYYKHWDSICTCTRLEEMVNAIKMWDIEFEPGSRYCYSNTGYLLLSYIIQLVSGMPFELFVQEHIFAPLNMRNSGTIVTGKVVKNKAFGYQVNLLNFEKNVLYNAPSVQSPKTLSGSGDLDSSIDDMYIWTQALFTGKILTQDSLNILFDSHVAMESSPERFHAYGFFIDKKFDKQIVEYSGSLVGYLSKVIRFIDDEITIVILTNREDHDQLLKIFEELPAIIFQ